MEHLLVPELGMKFATSEYNFVLSVSSEKVSLRVDAYLLKFSNISLDSV